MSDLFYPTKVSGDKYNIVILEFIPQLRYTVKNKPGQPMATIHEASPPSAMPTFKTKIPAAYYLHKFHNCATMSCILTTVVARFLQWMQVMLVMGCVALEFVVGHHDPTSVNTWHRNPENEDLNLERIYPDTLDWAAYNAALGNHLSGAYYKYSLANVRVRASWIQLLDAVRQWYGMTMRVVPKTQRKAIAPSVEPAKLVNGMAGLRYQLHQDIDEDRNAEGPKERKPTVGDTETQKQERREKKKERKKAEERHRMEAEVEADAQAAADAAAESKEELEQGMDVTDVDMVSEELVDFPITDSQLLQVCKAPTPVPLEGDVAMAGHANHPHAITKQIHHSHLTPFDVPERGLTQSPQLQYIIGPYDLWLV
ncbi:hypothetical protein PAXRUDRAFT_15309 [Paxillus rubicundulus Ve08.2h10]|uniref:Uncharacterized protein n=1 Tax=Paxillus rubicundulus Ve08.2h10 TaxID=930991 RepID=A0A0D0DIC3_9AGAM|nr:hypothetical protein PAXRUDRAFT_15309 [Paxillus rubicundulus Ve08.2h10]